MKRVLILSAALALTFSAQAQTSDTDDAAKNVDPIVWVVDYENSSVTFAATEQGESFDGKFSAFDADITLNPADLSSAKIIANVAIASVDAGMDMRNDALPSSTWFDQKSFPKATFESTEITGGPDTDYSADGTLTIKGISQDVTLPFKLVIDGDTAKATGTIDIDRSDFKVGTGAYADGQWIDFAVQINVDIKATKTE